MESVNKLEVMVAGWYKNLPHLPKELSLWLAQNAWWLVMIGAIVSGVGILGVLGLASGASVFFASFGAFGLGGIVFLGTILALLFGIVSVLLELVAIKPLKVMAKKGWDFVFLSVLVSLVGAIVGVVFSYNVGNLLSALVGAAISGYVLFEVRNYFVVGQSKSPKA